MQKPSLCIVSHNAYGALSGGRSGYIGGIEWQTSLTARWFAKQGNAVTMLTWDEGGPAEEVLEGVRVIKICRRSAGVRGLRFFHPKWTGLVHAMRRADADLYYQNGSECTTGQVALWCKRRHKPFVFSLASDADCTPEFPELSRHDHLLYRIGLKGADRRIAQTVTQSNRLRDNFGLDSVVIPMPCPDTAGDFAGPSPGIGRVLWVGRVCEVKRPDRLVELAALCPQLSFDLVGPFQHEPLSSQIRERAKAVSGLTLHGGVPRDQMPDYYRKAALLCCTSEYEGFPNTFLEAWSHGVPVVSTFDPDGVIARHNLGVVSKDIREMAAAIEALLAFPERYRQMSQNARKYFAQNHKADAVLPRFEKLFLEILKKSAS
jgi:glycosyltransferase involved in cell wall biosynthesis